MNTISIVIKGQAGVGKSAVAQFIEAALEGAGILVTEFDDGGGKRRSERQQLAALTTIGRKSQVKITVRLRGKS